MPGRFQQRGGASGDKPFTEKQAALCGFTKIPISEEYRAIVRLASEINGINVHPDTGYFNFGFRMALAKSSQGIEQPPHGKRAGGFEAQEVMFTSECPTCPLHAGETFAELPGKNPSGLTHLDSRALSFKKLTVEPQLKRPDMSADRARRNIERFSGFTE